MYSSTQAPSQDLKKHDWPPYQVSALELQRTYQLVPQLADQLAEFQLGAVPLRQYSRGQADAMATLPARFAALTDPVARILRFQEEDRVLRHQWPWRIDNNSDTVRDSTAPVDPGRINITTFRVSFPTNLLSGLNISVKL